MPVDRRDELTAHVADIARAMADLAHEIRSSFFTGEGVSAYQSLKMFDALRAELESHVADLAELRRPGAQAVEVPRIELAAPTRDPGSAGTTGLTDGAPPATHRVD